MKKLSIQRAMENSLELFKADIIKYCPGLPAAEWDLFKNQVIATSFGKADTIFPRTKVCKQVLFIIRGIAASEHQNKENQIINRFFIPLTFCTNIESILNDELNNDRLFAISPVQGFLISKRVFLEHYFHGGEIGLYIRKKVLEIIQEDKRFISIKTISNVKDQLAFLQTNYPEVILETPWKFIASYMGVTPAWLSRVLKKDI